MLHEPGLGVGQALPQCQQPRGHARQEESVYKVQANHHKEDDGGDEQNPDAQDQLWR
jgi:hypothetical protein